MIASKVSYPLSAAVLALCCFKPALAQFDLRPHVKTTSVSGEINYSHGTETGGSSLSRASSIGDSLSVEQAIGPLGYRSAASVGDGALHAGTFTTFDPQWKTDVFAPRSASHAEARATWFDTLVITGGTGLATGTFNAVVKGVMRGSAPSNTFDDTGVVFGARYLPGEDPFGFPTCGFFGQPPCTPADFEQQLGGINRTATSTTTLTMRDELSTDFAFQYGAPFRVRAELASSAVEGGYSNFSGSATFGIVLPEGATLVAHSGYDYGVTTVPVPEPETYAMTAVGLALLLLWKDRTAHSKRWIDDRRVVA